jgi:hypothetical protein
LLVWNGGCALFNGSYIIVSAALSLPNKVKTPLVPYQGCGSGSAWIRINLSFWIRIRIEEGKNDPENKKKRRNFMF